jgi:hypothetical protein
MTLLRVLLFAMVLGGPSMGAGEGITRGESESPPPNSNPDSFGEAVLVEGAASEPQMRRRRVRATTAQTKHRMGWEVAIFDPERNKVTVSRVGRLARQYSRWPSAKGREVGTGDSFLEWSFQTSEINSAGGALKYESHRRDLYDWASIENFVIWAFPSHPYAKWLLEVEEAGLEGAEDVLVDGVLRESLHFRPLPLSLYMAFLQINVLPLGESKDFDLRTEIGQEPGDEDMDGDGDSSAPPRKFWGRGIKLPQVQP